MLTVALRDRRGGTPIQFDILAASGIPHQVMQSQLDLALQLAPVEGIRYYFLVTHDDIQGWDLGTRARVFSEPTASVLAPYATAGDVRKAGPSYLAALVQAWVSDLASGWKHRTSPVPGQLAMQSSGALAVIRASESTTSGSL